ncbi:MAG: hypothetical protein V1807_02095 [Patescibacteria group bacterium]
MPPRDMLGVCDVQGPITDLLEKLGGSSGQDWLKALKLFLRKEEKSKVIHIINCHANLLWRRGWTVEEHREGDQLEWDPNKIQLYQSGQIYNNAREFYKGLVGKAVLNACVLDYLLAHPEIIPEEWKGKHIFFWGTVYKLPNCELCVRYLYWDGFHWTWDGAIFGYLWGSTRENFAALFIE